MRFIALVIAAIWSAAAALLFPGVPDRRGFTLAATASAATPRATADTPLWNGFGARGFRAWDALDGNTTSPSARAHYFSMVPDPAGGPGKVFKATVDQYAIGPGNEPGQRSLLENFPDSERRSNWLAAGVQGRDRWFRARFYFPTGFRPTTDSDWNWVVEWHNWPDSDCCVNLALTVDTDRSRGRGGERLSLVSAGGGTPASPADVYPHNRTMHYNHIVGDRHLKLNHWYDVLMHVVWDYRPHYGLVQWWLDGRLITSRRTSTLNYYRDSNGSGGQPGPGRTYLEIGYYRDSRLLNGRPDTSTMSVYHADDRVGTTFQSVF